METRYNRTNRKVATESAQDGCQVYSNCLECPLPICIMDMTPPEARRAVREHKTELIELQSEGDDEAGPDLKASSNPDGQTSGSQEHLQHLPAAQETSGEETGRGLGAPPIPERMRRENNAKPVHRRPGGLRKIRATPCPSLRDPDLRRPRSHGEGPGAAPAGGSVVPDAR